MDFNVIMQIVKTAVTITPEFTALFNEVKKAFNEKDVGLLEDAYELSFQKAGEQHQKAQEL